MFSCSIVHRLYPDHEGSLSLSHSRKRAQSLASLLQLCALVRVRRGAISTPLTPPPPRPGGARRSATTSSTARADASGTASTRVRSTRVADDGGATSPRRCFYLLCRMLVFCYFLVRTLVFCTFVLQPLGHHYTPCTEFYKLFHGVFAFFCICRSGVSFCCVSIPGVFFSGCSGGHFGTIRAHSIALLSEYYYFNLGICYICIYLM